MHIYLSAIDAVHIILPIDRVVKTALLSSDTVTSVLSLGTTDGSFRFGSVEFLGFKEVQVGTARETGEARPE